MSSIKEAESFIGDWVAVMRLLKCPVVSAALPALTACPVCEGRRMHVSEDNRTPGTWHYCHDCRFAGDISALAAAVWKCSRPFAIRKLANEGLGRPVYPTTADRNRSWPHLDTAVREHWHKAKILLADCRRGRGLPAAARMLARLLIIPPGPRWSKGPGLMVGTCEAHSVRALLGARATEGVFPARLDDIGARMLIAAHYDKPGRICGYSIATGSCEARELFYCPVQTGAATSSIREAGLAGWETLAASQRLLSGYAIAVNDPFFAARLQSRHIDTAQHPLPIVAYRDSPIERTMRGWDCLDGRSPVFWAESLSASVLHHARMTNGFISFRHSHGDVKLFNHELRNQAIIYQLENAVKRAFPWKMALTKWSRESPPARLEELAMGLESYGDIAPYKGVCADFDAVIESSLPKNDRAILDFHGVRINERDDCWYATSKRSAPRLITNFTLRIDGATTDPPGYLVQVRCKGYAVQLELPLAVCQKTKMVPAIQKKLLELKAPCILYTETGWHTQLLNIAQRFYAELGQ